MLETCPECKLQVSDRAAFCPRCGYPFRENHIISSPKNHQRKRKRLPNGFGQITKIKNGNLRAPYRAMITVGKAENGRPICKLLKPQSYFESYNEAYEALLNYNKNPYDISETITMDELFKKWIDSSGKTGKRKNDYTSTWDYCREIYDEEIRQVRINQLKLMIDRATADRKGIMTPASARTKTRIKCLLNLLYDYAVENELVTRNLARSFSLDSSIRKEIFDEREGHIAFSTNELTMFWKNINLDGVELFLVNCYTGWRPSELLNIKLSDIDTEKWLITGGMKTDAGRERIVPIHSGIKNIITKLIANANHKKSEWLIPSRRNPENHMSYEDYRRIFNLTLKTLNLSEEHKPHDMRKTFVTLAKEYKLDEWAIKRIIGHHIADITERVYTERTIDWYHEEIEKIKIDCQKCDI